MYQGETNNLTFEDIKESPNFVLNDSEVPNLGVSKKNSWLRFTIRNESSRSHYLLEIAYPILDEIELFYPDESGNYQSVLLTEKHPFYDRKYHVPTFLFDLTLQPRSSAVFYLRVTGTEQVILPAYVNTEKGFWFTLVGSSVMNGMYIGIVLIMAVYNLFIYASVRDKSYIFYVLYIVFAGLTQMGIKGYNFQYLWPSFPSIASSGHILAACFSGIAALLFADSFLRLRRNAPKARPVIAVFISLFAISVVLVVLGFRQIGLILMQLTTGAGSVTVLFLSFRVMMRGYSPAKYFVWSWTILLLGSIIFLLKDYGVLRYTAFTSNVVSATSIVEMALLSFGLAHRINVLKKQKEVSQAATLRALQENENLIRQQNIVLEQKVEERTLELTQSNNELELALKNLKEAQSQLVESEKMASLGQLTAGVAHEINNPINFVTSNVTPLRRDLGMLVDALSAIEEIALSDHLSSPEKEKAIASYKEELDFDYLKEEISFLLNGMYEGATRTSEIVKSLRIFSRVDEDTLKMADINECLDSTLVIVNSLLNDKNVRVEKDFGTLPLVECYPGKLNQVFLNIISNAIYAIDKQHHENRKGGVLFIRTSLDTPDVTITIRDNGIGMDEKTKQKIFEPFFTTKDVGEGTGLGMSIAYNTIKKHEGEIIVNTAPGEGAEFILTIPLQQKK